MKYEGMRPPKWGSHTDEVMGDKMVNKEFTLEILSDKIHYYHSSISAKEARSLLEKELKEWEVKRNISEVDFWVSYLPELVKYFSRQPASKVKGWIEDK
tara:strand:+ start:1738 stop:2034 length:297 start_codon:yes stop_codon:yes gene_type:complete